MTVVYLDMDGVLADFNAGLTQRGAKQCLVTYITPFKERTPEQHEITRRVEECMMSPGFWKSLPIMDGANSLWKAAGSPYVLTALPALSIDKRISQEKKTWISKNFGESASQRVITCLRSEKVRFAKVTADSPDLGKYYHKADWSTRTDDRKWLTRPNILIDDHPKNCQEWTDAGGYAILYEDAKQSISDLKKALKYLNG